MKLDSMKSSKLWKSLKQVDAIWMKDRARQSDKKIDVRNRIGSEYEIPWEPFDLSMDADIEVKLTMVKWCIST